MLYWALVFHKLDRNLFIVLVMLTIGSLLVAVYPLGPTVKQLANIWFAAIVSYAYILIGNHDIDAIFRKYIAVSKIVLLLGFLQVVLVAVGLREWFYFVFPFLSDSHMSIRFQSVTQEPSYIAFTFAPVVFLSLYNLFYRASYHLSRTWSVLFVVSYVLTLSTVAFAGLFVMILMLDLRRMTFQKYLFAGLATLLIFASSWLVYNFIEPVKLRIDDTWHGLRHGLADVNVIRKLNLSSYAFLSNLYVTTESLKENPLTGSGLGTHANNYDRFIPEELKKRGDLNREEANSLAFRLLSETGITGFVLFLVFLIRYRIRSGTGNGRSDLLWIINNGILVMIILCLIRNGHYTLQGRMLFLLLYYYSYRAIKHEQTGNLSHSVA